MPEYLMKQCGLVPLHVALRNIHFPKDMASLEKAKYRLKFEQKKAKEESRSKK